MASPGTSDNPTVDKDVNEQCVSLHYSPNYKTALDIRWYHFQWKILWKNNLITCPDRTLSYKSLAQTWLLDTEHAFSGKMCLVIVSPPLLQVGNTR